MLLENLNTKQRNAVLSENKRILVLAGAGSGKTKTVISKLLHLVSESGHSGPTQPRRGVRVVQPQGSQQ